MSLLQEEKKKKGKMAIPINLGWQRHKSNSLGIQRDEL
jgi:hypothetical protein